MKRLGHINLAMILITIFFPSAAKVQVINLNSNRIYVAKTGNDLTGTGASANPFLSINKAIKLASSLDTVIVDEGVYTEKIEYINKSIILKSLSGLEVTEISGNNEFSIFKLTNCYLSLDGFTIKDGVSSFSGGGINATCTDLSISNCAFVNNRVENYEWARGGAIAYTNSDSTLVNQVTIRNCRFENNYAANYGGALAFKTSNSNDAGLNLLIKDCLFYNNQAGALGEHIIQEYNKNFEVTSFVISGLHSVFTINNSVFTGAAKTNDAVSLFIYGKASGTIANCLFTHEPTVIEGNPAIHRAIHIANKTRVEISDCTMINHTLDEYPNLLISGGGNARVLNSILWGNNQQIHLQNVNSLGGNLDIDYSDIQNGLASVKIDRHSILNWREHNIDSDPLFCNPDSANYSLHENSPCLYTGENNATIGKYGMGCYTSSIAGNRNEQFDFCLVNYPNPFNQSTIIQYTNPAPGLVTMNIYDIQSRLVKSLINEFTQPGRHSILWDGSNSNHSAAASGIYFGVLQVAGQRQVIKLVYAK